MKQSVQILVLGGALIIALSLVGCGGGGSSGGSGGSTSYPAQYTHDQWAHLFADGLPSATLVKADTQQEGYIVILNSQSGQYEAYDISALANFKSTIAAYASVYPPVIVQPTGNNNYMDPVTGTQFQKTNLSAQKNLAKIEAAKESLVVQNNAQALRGQYGLSVETALNVARFAYKIKNSPRGSYSKADYDDFMKEMTGSSITDFEMDVKNGNNESLQSRIQKAQQMTGMGPEGVNKFINDVFGQ